MQGAAGGTIALGRGGGGSGIQKFAHVRIFYGFSIEQGLVAQVRMDFFSPGL